jgi:hypothetical protein
LFSQKGAEAASTGRLGNTGRHAVTTRLRAVPPAILRRDKSA